MLKKENINGVNVARLFETIDAINEKPEIARFSFRANNKWINGANTRTTINDYYGACETHIRNEPFVFENDEPPVLLGNDIGASPLEYLLAGLAGCVTTGLVFHAAERGIAIEEVESIYEGDLDLRGFLGLSDDVRSGYEKINITLRIKSKASREQLEELVEIAKGRSPVFDVLSNPVPVNIKLSV